MINVWLSNPPQDAFFWRPYFRVGGAGGTTYYPDRLGLQQGWQVDLAGSIDFRVDLYDENQQIIYEYQTYFAPVEVISGRSYTFDYNIKELVEITEENGEEKRDWTWPVIIGGGILIGGLIAFSRR